jgi:hypothetical protein
MNATAAGVLHGPFSGRLLERCPACGDDRLVAVIDDDEGNLLCTLCERCWHVELGRVSQVNPLTCMRCTHREECLAHLARGPLALPAADDE